MRKTRLSSKGQVVLPKAVRDAQHWHEGTVLLVEIVPEGVLLREPTLGGTTTAADLLGCVGYRGRRLSIEEMDAAIAREGRRR